MSTDTPSEAKKAEGACKLGRESNIVGHGRFQFLESIENALSENELSDLRDRLGVALRYFPHLWDHTITVGVLEEHEERSRDGSDTAATALVRNYTVHVRTDKRISNSTLFHELAHLEIYKRVRNGADLPRTSEEFCDIYAVARMEPGLLFDDDSLSYIGEPSVPLDDWPRICRKALAYREDKRNYIQKAREWLGVGDGGSG